MVQVSCHTENEGDQKVVVFSLRLSGGEGGLATTKEVTLAPSLNVRLQDNCENAIRINAWKTSSNLLSIYIKRRVGLLDCLSV